MNEALQRWDTFLSKIKDRAYEQTNALRGEALTMVQNSNGDPVPVSKAIHAIQLQIQQLINKIDNTWQEQVEQALISEKHSSSKIEQQRVKGVMVQIELNKEIWRVELDVNYQVAEYIFSLAEANKRTSINCSQCSASLSVPEHTYVMEHITCNFCQTVNTYEPGTYQRLVGSYCAEHFAQWDARELILETVEAQERLQLMRDEEFERGKVEWRSTHRRYSEKYLMGMKRFMPNLDVAKELELIMNRI